MPDLKNCRQCGKMFTYMSGLPVCPDCKKKEEEDFKNVKEYLYKNPGVTMAQVAVALEIPFEKLKHYLKEGRLEIVGEGNNLVLECERCGVPIKSGKYCDECGVVVQRELKSVGSNMESKLRSAEEENKAKTGGGLRYLNKDKNERR